MTSIILSDVLSVRWLLLGGLPIKFSLKYLQPFLPLTSIGKFRLLWVHRELRHQDDGDKNVTNLHIWQWNSSFACFARVIFIFTYISLLFSFFRRREVIYLTVVWMAWADRQIFNIFLLSPNRWYQFNSKIFRIHFASMMTWNNGEISAETRSYIFGWRSHCRRRRPCLSSQWKRLTVKELYYCVCK